ncbi:MAG: Calx-beta domain-containing protein, partial [Clostridiales bacterium]|nr:Calx-beta domain-containing protein [Clostridiales bacterium]
MKGKQKGLLKRIISTALSFSMIAGLIQIPVHAEAVDVYIPEIEIGEDILSSDVFYLTAANARLNEGANERYLLRLARGGDCDSESGVTVKISDLTAKYGRDYTISVYGSDVEADSPENNESLIERMEGEEYTESELKTEEEYAEMLKENDELREQTADAVQNAVDYIEEESGALESESSSADSDNSTADETVSINPLQQARQTYTGVSGEPQRITSTTDTMQQIQQMANVITNAVVGANITVDFAAGESEKYISIDVKENHEGDGDRYFYLMLAAPYGTTTNSAASSCAVTIIDDEEQAPSEIGFAEKAYSASGDSVTVEITREGALNTIAAAHLTTEGGTAQTGRDFSPVDMDVVFPMGIDKRTIDIPIRTEYLVGEADFTLTLEALNDCVITHESASVTIEGTAGQTEQDSISLMGVEESARVSDIVLGDAIDLSKPVKTGHGDHYDGSNHYDSQGKQWYMEWIDDSFWWSYYDAVGASWTLSESKGADIAGVQIDWARTGNCAAMKAYFVGSGSRDIAWNYGNGGNSYDSKKNFGDGTKTNAFCTYWDPVRISIMNNGYCDDCNRLWIHGIKPIFRPFVVNLQNADPLTFLNGDGSRSEWKDATFLALAGANNDTNNQVVRYSKEGKNAVTFQQTIGGNVTTPYVYLQNVRIIKDGRSKEIARYGNDGGTSQTFTMNSDWINNNSSYIYFEENNSSNAWKNQTGTFGLRGRIELKPTFGYKDAKVKINVPKNDYGYFKISGENKKISSSQTYTYHRGDILKLSTVMRDEYKDMYEPAGYMVSYKHNESDTRWVKQGVIVPYDKDNGTSNFLDDNQRLRYGYYEVTPLFQRTGNAIAVRVKKSDLSKFDTSYGFFNTDMVDEKNINGVDYCEYIFDKNPVYGKIYALSVRMAENAGATYYPVWSEPNSSKLYDGEAFYHTASNNAENNIITLSCENSGYADIYQSVKGSIYRPTYNMQTKEAGITDMTPATGAIVSFGMAFSVVDADGKFETLPFRAMNDYKGSREHYIRYIISSNGDDLLKELRLSQTKGEYKEVGVIKDGDEDSISKVNVWVNPQNIGQQAISSENGSIISNIDVYTDNPNQGNNLILDGDTVAVKAKMREPVKYTKVIANQYSGKLIEYPNTDETVTGIKFVVYDTATKTERSSHEAKKKDGEFTADIPVSEILPGDRLYMRVTTDKSHGIYSETVKKGRFRFGRWDPNATSIVKKQDEQMNTTTYADVFTGYTFTQKNTEKVPVLQHVDLPIDMTFTALPLIGNTAMQFDLPFVSVGTIKTDTGYKMYIGVSPTQITDTALDKHMTSYAGDTGAYYKDLFSIKNPIQSFKEGLVSSYKDAFKNVPENYAGATSALGAPTWKLDVQIGVYFEFVYTTITNPNNGYSNKACVFTGVGGYVGVSAGVKMAWYTIIPVVFIPAYFGIDISGNVLGFFGAGTDTSKPKITYDDASNATVDFDNRLGEFHASVKMAATVQIYVGVGLAGTIGLRGGGTFTAMGLWEPSDLVSDWGADLVFTAGVWVDLFLFSVPVQYTFPDIKFGSFEEYANLVVHPEVQVSSADEAPEFSVRKPYSDEPSEWMPDQLQMMSAFGEVSSKTIVENGYEHPDVQLIKLADGSVFMAFLDTDMSRGITERTVLKYALYKDGSWSDPKIVQNDATADFRPSICEIDGGRVMISWLSSDPAEETTDKSEEYLSKLEVYTAVINPSTGEITEETRLTNDSYYDYSPTSVYDEKTGDRIVYYVKTASTGKAEEMINSYTNDCVVVYMLYSKEQGRWLFDYYYDEEVASDEDRQNLIENWHGQRFLASPIPELGFDVPNISDFTAITYNGISVYAYTIDKDSSNDTSFDKEMFIQCYDFEKHRTYVPIRITNDNVCDTLPQFVRTGSGEAADTKLFWYRDEKDVAYIDISSLIHDGVNDDGTIKDEYLTSGDGEKKDIDSLYSYVSAAVDNPQGTRSMADFKAVVDNDDIYIVWTQPVSVEGMDDDGNYKQCREVYATALIQDENADNNTEPSENEPSDDESGCSWADPYRLTNTNAFTDEPNAVTDGSGNLMVLYNCYNQTITDNPQNPVEITDFKLKASYMEPCGAVDVTDIKFSDETPADGDTIEVNVDVKNVGLTYADGYTVNIYEMKDGVKGSLVHTITSGGKLLPGNTNGYTFEWTVPENA